MKIPSNNRLKLLWWGAIAGGVLSFLAGLYWASSSQGPGLDWIWGVAIFGAAVLCYNILFFLLCSIFAPALASLVQDDTEVRGDDVTHVVEYTKTGDDLLDPYVRAYASARGISAVSIVSGIMIAIALAFF